MYATEVLRVMRAALKANAALSAQITEIYDVPPEAPDFPFVTTGESQSFPNDSLTGQGIAHTISINCWSEVSKAECRKITETINRALHRVTLPLTQGTVDFYYVEDVTTFEPENRLFRGMIRFRAYANPTS